jgi:hypothetical protein
VYPLGDFVTYQPFLVCSTGISAHLQHEAGNNATLDVPLPTYTISAKIYYAQPLAETINCTASTIFMASTHPASNFGKTEEKHVTHVEDAYVYFADTRSTITILRDTRHFQTLIRRRKRITHKKGDKPWNRKVLDLVELKPST